MLNHKYGNDFLVNFKTLHIKNNLKIITNNTMIEVGMKKNSYKKLQKASHQSIKSSYFFHYFVYNNLRNLKDKYKE